MVPFLSWVILQNNVHNSLTLAQLLWQTIFRTFCIFMSQRISVVDIADNLKHPLFPYQGLSLGNIDIGCNKSILKLNYLLAVSWQISAFVSCMSTFHGDICCIWQHKHPNITELWSCLASTSSQCIHKQKQVVTACWSNLSINEVKQTAHVISFTQTYYFIRSFAKNIKIEQKPTRIRRSSSRYIGFWCSIDRWADVARSPHMSAIVVLQHGHLQN